MEYKGQDTLIYQPLGKGPDIGMISSIYRKENGGIDLTAGKMNLRTRIDSRFRGNDRVGDGNDSDGVWSDNGGIKFHIDPAMLARLEDAPGFVPVIVSLEPMVDLRKFLEVRLRGPVKLKRTVFIDMNNI